MCAAENSYVMPLGWRLSYSWRWSGKQQGTTSKSEEGFMDGGTNFTQQGKAMSFLICTTVKENTSKNSRTEMNKANN